MQQGPPDRQTATAEPGQDGDTTAGPTPQDVADPKGLVRESYRIEGITAAECRSIFVDWALSLAKDADVPGTLRALIARHADAAPDHPMTAVLREGLGAEPLARRRGGRAGRFAPPV